MPEIQKSYYSMKQRRGGLQPTVRDKLLAHRLHSCPGNVYHFHPRREILFNHRVRFGHKCYVMYWRTHANEHKDMLQNCRQNNRVSV
jgi:hypothetical protein